MFSKFFTWRVFLALVAIVIIVASIGYSNYLAKKIEKEERNKIGLWIEAKNTQIKAEDGDALAITLASAISENNKDIPIIFTNEKDSIIDYINLDSQQVANNSSYLPNQLRKFKKENLPIIWTNPLDSTQKDKLYFGHSKTLKQLRWYPIIQILVIALFSAIMLANIYSRNKAAQNQVWVGMAKETAHQLGTPLSSLNGWMEVLKTSNLDPAIVSEIQRDVERLDLVSDRFGKIGSKPQFAITNISHQISKMVDYMRKRASGKVSIHLQSEPDNIEANISPQLFDWVIENLLKNALDAMDGKGNIHVLLRETNMQIQIDVTDTGKGIARKNWSTVFKPGFTTKKRGWGLGLSLTKRIVEEYHGGKIYVKDSQLGRGTTFRIELRK